MMKRNSMRILCFALAMVGFGSTVSAQTAVNEDLAPTIQPQQYRICNERPERPAWAESLPIREAWKGLTLRGLYELRAWESIAATEDCSCAVRFPDWAAAENEFQKSYAALTQGEQTALRRQLRASKNALAEQVEAICKAQGNW